MAANKVIDTFSLDGKVAVVTGGAGLLGRAHVEALTLGGAECAVWDVNAVGARALAKEMASKSRRRCSSQAVDVSDPRSVREGLRQVLSIHGKVNILLNNAAINPKVESGGIGLCQRLEHFTLEDWNRELAVGLTGAMLCAQALGSHMAEMGGGVILNICSDLALIAPNQGLYAKPGLPQKEQPVKPVTYSVIKHGLLGLTKYLATYWSHKNVRANALSPGGVFAGQPADFVTRITEHIPLGRMARLDEYQGAIVFLCSDASAYMNGANLVMDGGRTVW